MKIERLNRLVIARLHRNRSNLLLHFIALLVLCTHGVAADCRIAAVQWSGDHELYDESQMSSVVGEPCENWTLARDQLLRYYENHGFLAAKLS